MLGYLQERITDEINDAIAYMRKAVENCGKPCSRTFAMISDQELRHASALYKVFQAQEKPTNMADKDYSAMLKAIMDKFSDGMSEIESMKKLCTML